MIVCVAGNPSIDKLFEVEMLFPDAIHRPMAFVSVPGGKGLNAARAAAALGAPVVATGILGGHAGRWISDALDAEGVPGRFAWASGETRSSLSVADRHSGDLTEFYESGARITIEEWDALERIVRELLKGANWVTFSGSLPPGAPPDGYSRLMVAAVDMGVRTGLDARGGTLRWGMEGRPDLVKVNRDEAGELMGNSIHGLDDAARAARELRLRCGGAGHAAVITLGEEGAVLVAPDGSAWDGGLIAPGRYPVGSGDAFLAGLVTVLDQAEGEWPVEDALRLALGAAAANAATPGAGHIDPSWARTLATQAKIRRLT